MVAGAAQSTTAKDKSTKTQDELITTNMRQELASARVKLREEVDKIEGARAFPVDPTPSKLSVYP
jgi:hypothetical protein